MVNNMHKGPVLALQNLMLGNYNKVHGQLSEFLAAEKNNYHAEAIIIIKGREPEWCNSVVYHP